LCLIMGAYDLTGRPFRIRTNSANVGAFTGEKHRHHQEHHGPLADKILASIHCFLFVPFAAKVLR